MTQRRQPRGQLRSQRQNSVRRSGSYLLPNNSRMLLRPFLPEGDHRAREIIQRILQLSPAGVECGLREVNSALRNPLVGIDAIFAQAMPTVAPPSATDQRAIAVSVSADRRLLHERVQLTIGGTVQPLHGPAPGSGRVPPGSLQVHHQPACHRRGASSRRSSSAAASSAPTETCDEPTSGSSPHPRSVTHAVRKADIVGSWSSWASTSFSLLP